MNGRTVVFACSYVIVVYERAHSTMRQNGKHIAHVHTRSGREREAVGVKRYENKRSYKRMYTHVDIYSNARNDKCTTRKYAYTSTCTQNHHVHAPTHTYIRTCTRTYTHIHTHVHTPTDTHIHAHAYMHTCIHACTHTHTNTTRKHPCIHTTCIHAYIHTLRIKTSPLFKVPQTIQMAYVSDVFPQIRHYF